MSRHKNFSSIKRIVIKIGTSNITENGMVSRDRIFALTSDIISLIELGYSIVIVSSGAISAGSGSLNKNRENLSIPMKQALASVGQPILINEYRNCFQARGYNVGQILLTEDDVNNRVRFLNARHTFNTLIGMGVIPIVNENDSVAINEIKFGDNDILSAYVSNMIEADLLILLSDVDGFYRNLSDKDPISEIQVIDDEIKSSAGGPMNTHGTGGMISKIRAAEIIIRCGEMMIIANGMKRGILSRIVNGEPIGTLFIGHNRTLSCRKRWIAFNKKTMGRIIIDNGAFIALCHEKRSLLASGIIRAEGDFDLGDAVDLLTNNNEKIGKGIVNYSFNEVQIIIGKKTSEIRDILKSSYYDEVINRDDLIIY